MEPNDAIQPLMGALLELVQREELAPESAEQPQQLENLGSALKPFIERENRAAGEPDVTLNYVRSELKQFPPNHLERPKILTALVNITSRRGKRTGNPEDLDEAIQYARELLDCCSSERFNALQLLAELFYDRWCVLEDLADLDKAINRWKEALAIGGGSPAKFATLNQMPFLFLTRYEHRGQSSDLHAAQENYRRHMTVAYPSKYADPDLLLHSNSEGMTSTECLEDMIDIQRQKLELQPTDGASRHEALIQLSSGIRVRFSRLQSLIDLDESIELKREALRIFSGPPYLLDGFANLILIRYRISGDVADVDEAIQIRRQILEIYPAQILPQRQKHLFQLATTIVERFTTLHMMEDLDEAIQVYREALEQMNGNPILRCEHLSSLAHLLRTRYKKMHRAEDWDEVLALHSHALKLIRVGEPYPRSLEFLTALIAGRNRESVESDASIACIESKDGTDSVPVRLFHEL